MVRTGTSTSRCIALVRKLGLREFLRDVIVAITHDPVLAAPALLIIVAAAAIGAAVLLWGR